MEQRKRNWKFGSTPSSAASFAAFTATFALAAAVFPLAAGT
jgi:hypothetical protein